VARSRTTAPTSRPCSPPPARPSPRRPRPATSPAPEDGAALDSRGDVILVEDDDALAEVLPHALRTRGWVTHVIGDGDEAADQLGGADPQKVRRVLDGTGRAR
jgi:hypothetical protein